MKVPFWLTPVKVYVGPAWYQRTISVPEKWKGKRVCLFLERAHWQTHVWLDDRDCGTQDSLSTPHVYDLGQVAPGEHRLTIRVDNRLAVDVGCDAHSVTDHTQTNWNGLVGRLELQATDPVWIDDVQVYPDIAAKKAVVRITIGNATANRLTRLCGLRRWAATTGSRFLSRAAVARFERGARQVDRRSLWIAGWPKRYSCGTSSPPSCTALRRAWNVRRQAWYIATAGR